VTHNKLILRLFRSINRINSFDNNLPEEIKQQEMKLYKSVLRDLKAIGIDGLEYLKTPTGTSEYKEYIKQKEQELSVFERCLWCTHYCLKMLKSGAETFCEINEFCDSCDSYKERSETYEEKLLYTIANCTECEHNSSEFDKSVGFQTYCKIESDCFHCTRKLQIHSN